MRFGRRKADRAIDHELRYHFDKLVRDFIAACVSPDEAHRRARLEFGGLEQSFQKKYAKLMAKR